MEVAGNVSCEAETTAEALSLPPGARLAGVLESLIPFTLEDRELIGALRAFRRLVSWAQAGELEIIAELARRRPAGAHERSVNEASPVTEFLVDEVEMALTLTGTGAACLVDLALALCERLPATLGALRAGLVDSAKARVMAQGTSAVTAEVAARVEAQVLGKAPDLTTSQLRSKVARAVIAADPQAAERRREAAEGQRDVRCHEERDGSGTATISGRHLPADQAIAAANRLNAIARGLKADGDSRRLGAIRADVLLAMMLGLLPADLRPHAGPEHASGRSSPPPGDPGEGRPASSGTSAATGPGHPGGPGRPRGPSDRVGDDPPGPSRPEDGDRHGGQDPVPWYEAAEQDLTHDPYEQGDDLPAHRDAEIAARAGARIGTVNLTIPLTTYLGLGQAPADIPGYGPLLAAVARILADNATRPGTAWCITVLDDEGRPIQHGETRYRPGPALRRKIEARNPVCVFPQCRRPARACDLDHCVPYGTHDQAITCGCNLQPLCRRHHRIKQAKGWRLDQLEPGHHVWTTPSGERHHVGPEEQPL
ncbi:DUF222 domain-containing protein [Actinomadura scrupuli]|uniref:HNH endonuclease signature motif containing protein n=1 Tax=Actinomadura scrupuli TaxID=559629 RepID=UPI003D9782BA